MIAVDDTIAGVRARVAAARREGARIGMFPTMGALHEGHLANLRLVAAETDLVVVSIFVNPLQFDRADDLATYPRDLDGDLAALAATPHGGSTSVFAPSLAAMYPTEPATTVHVRGLTEVLEGAARPGHFDGVATVVTKLLTIVAPDVAVFGRKDHQQLQVVRRLVADLDLPVSILAAPTIREADGLALSSRNRHLGASGRADARALPLALGAAVRHAQASRLRATELSPSALVAAAERVLAATPGVRVDYLEVVDSETLRAAGGPVAVSGRVTVTLAAWVDGVRLIDNVEVGDLDDEARLLAAIGGTPAAVDATSADQEG